ncbi:hypothetical protein H0X90_21635 [Burkholderia sp. 9775_39]|uniref:hypothetical protein n=1 Tax=Burkholderia TaxID=32008 RepID=UPI0018C4129A|nr:MULTISPECIES: hypothetical protein [Burkholderia]MBG0879395.1 hypothetical protein [Burkholderia sp. 9775_39]MBG0884536.1 hypothetical protein [Burkholderia sp. 9773_38]
MTEGAHQIEGSGMELRKLQHVIDDLTDAIGRWPELVDDVFAFVFDGGCVRDGLYSIRTASGKEVKVGEPIRFDVRVDIFAAPELAQFAVAVAQGVVPAMPLVGGAGRQ